MSCIWLTRPQADSASIAAALTARGIASCIAPVMRIAPLPFEPPAAAPDALLLTSRHAVPALPRHWQHLPVFCVGTATAEAVRAQDFRNLHVGPGDLLQLLPLIVQTLTNGQSLLYLSGEDIQLDPAPLLAMQQIHCTRIAVYEAVAEAMLPSFLRMRLEAGDITGAAFFSARSARLACRLLVEEGLAAHAAQMDAYCLSLPVAEAAGALPWRRVHASHTPSREAMLEMIASLAGQIAS